MLAAFYAAARAALASSRNRRLAWSGACGGLIGVSAYVRVVSDLLGWLMLALLVVWGVLTLLRRWRRSRRAPEEPDGDDEPSSPTDWRQALLALAVCALVFQAVTIPWRVYGERKIHPGSYGWTAATGNVWHNLWIPDAVLIERGQQWLLEGRPNSVCKVDPERCREIARYERKQYVPYSGWGRYTDAEYRRLAIETIREHPVEYAADRVYWFGQAWFWSPWDRTREVVQNSVLTVAVLAALWLSFRRLRRAGPDLLTLVYPGLVLASLAPFVTLHFEARYFATVKLLGLLGAATLVALDPDLPRRWRIDPGGARQEPAQEPASSSLSAS
jgi:hypothetical protein